MSIKLIAMDMDGTLLDDDHATVPARNIAALQRAREKGVKLVIASGRTWSLIWDAAEQLGGVDYAILANGAAIREAETGKHIYENGFPNPQAAALIQLLLKEKLPFEMYSYGQNYVQQGEATRLSQGLFSEAFVKRYLASVKVVPDLIKALEGRTMEKINLFYAPPEQRERIRKLAELTGPMELTNSLEGNMEFNYGGASKGKALTALAAHLGLTSDEVMAFGDANNDLTMLRWAGWSFAMANASEEAKAAAKRLTASNHEAGVGQAVEKFVLEE